MTDPTFGHVTPDTLALFTDRYELTMMQGYVETAHEPTATFSLFFRELPADRGYLLAAGLEQVVAYLYDLSFSERALAHLEAEGFGPGTALATSADAPTLDLVYKLVGVERDGRMEPTMKLSPGKVTYPGEKSVRRLETGGEYVEDVLGTRGEGGPGRELLVDVFDGGELVYDVPGLDQVREVAGDQVDRLPEPVRRLREPSSYPVTASDRLEQATSDLWAELARQVGD